MDIELKLPPEEKDEFGFTPSQNKEIEEQLTRPSPPKGLFKNFVKASDETDNKKEALAKALIESNKLAEQETPAQTWTRLDKTEKKRQKDHLKKLITHNVTNSSVSVSKAEQGSEQHKADVMNYINKKVGMYEGGGVKIDPPILKDNINSKRYENKSLSKFENRTDDPNTVTFNPTTQLFTNKDRTIAFKDYNSADNYNKSLRVKPKYPTQASPEQFGKLAETLERDRQMRGAPTNLKEFGHRFNENKKEPQYPGMKAWQKNKKISTPTTPIKTTLPTYTPFIAIDFPKPDPQMLENEKRFNRMRDEINEEKKRINNSGLAGLLGGVKNGE